MILTVWILLRQGKGPRSDHDEFPSRARGCDWVDCPVLDLKTVML